MLKHYSSYLYYIQASHSTITSYKQQGRENEWQRMGVEKTHTKKDSKAPVKRAAGTAEGETTIRNMLRDMFLPDIFAWHSVFIIKTTYFPVYKNNTINNVKNTTELKNIYSMNKYMNKWLRKNIQW